VEPRQLRRREMEHKGKVDVHDSEYARFLKKLAHDDDFRERLEKDPKKVLAEYSVTLGADDLPSDVKLPPKEEIQAKFEDLLAGLETGRAEMAFGFFWRWR
jgi:putative modified peptide